MREKNEPYLRVSSRFRYLLLSVAILSFLLIVAGIAQRVSGTSEACPGWPTCMGEWLPSVSGISLAAYLHRVVAALAGVLLVISTWVAWGRFRRVALISRSLLAALALLAIQIWIGRSLALGDEPSHRVSTHLALALGIHGLVLVATVVAFRRAASLPEDRSNASLDLQPAQPRGSQAGRLSFRSPFGRLSLLTLFALFGLFVSGAWASASGAASSCLEWPVCQGMLFPETQADWVNLVHRSSTLLAGILMALVFLQAWRSQRSQTPILVSTTAAVVLFFSQALMGSVEAARGYPAYLLGLHAATAAAVWGAQVIQVVLVGLAGRARAEEAAEVAGIAGRRASVLIKDLLMLTKPVVVALLLVTTFAGMVVGAEAWPSFRLVFWTLLGGAMAAGGSGAINQYIDRFDDEKMQRTSRRPIPSGRLTPGEGLAFGVGLALASFYLMVALVNFLAALLALLGIIYYVLLYSLLLKKATVQNIVIGGGAGAIPPLVGWAAATGSLNIPALFLFAVIFMWTPPHFWALALVRRNDYARAGVPMLPVVRGERETRWQIFLYTIELVALTLLLPLFGLGGGIYFVAAAVLGGALLFSAWKVWRGQGNKVAWMMYRHSSMYLAFLFLALMVDALL